MVVNRMGAAGLAAVVALTLCGCRQTWSSQMVSVNADGTNGGNGWSDHPAISPDGTKVAFVTDANDLGPVDTNQYRDVYVRDLTTGATHLVSADSTGSDSGNRGADLPEFSPDGTKVLFTSRSSDLVPTDANDTTDVFLRDLHTGTTSLISTDGSGNSRGGHGAVFSPDGTRIAFISSPDTPTGPATSGSTIFVRDLTTGETSAVLPEGPTVPASVTTHLTFSPDSTRIAFVTTSDALGPHDSRNGGSPNDVYVRDLVNGTTVLVSANATNTNSGNSYSDTPVFSPDGSMIAFHSYANDLGPTDTNAYPDIYVRDLSAGTTRVVSADPTGVAAGFAHEAVFSPDSTAVAFVSAGHNFGPVDTNGEMDIYLRDLSTETTSLVSVNAAGDDSGNRVSAAPSFTASGSTIVFSSRATDLGPPDTIVSLDVYARDLDAGVTHLISRNGAGGGGGDMNTTEFVISASGRIAFTSSASNLGPVDINGEPDVYVATRNETP